VSRESPLTAAVGGVLLFAIGLAIAAGLFIVNRHESQAIEGWHRADGTVVDLLKRRTAGREVATPLIAFTTTTGERINFTATVTGQASEYQPTAHVPVIYDPAFPQAARIDPRSRRWTRNALGTGAAIILLGLGGYVAWYASRWQPSPEGKDA
jgi:hypothetical protein